MSNIVFESGIVSTVSVDSLIQYNFALTAKMNDTDTFTSSIIDNYVFETDIDTEEL